MIVFTFMGIDDDKNCTNFNESNVRNLDGIFNPRYDIEVFCIFEANERFVLENGFV